MTNAVRDNNQVPTMLATSNADGKTPVLVCANPTDHTMCSEDGVSGSDLSGDDAKRDDNGVPVMMAVSSADGVTPCPVYVNAATNKVLLKTS